MEEWHTNAICSISDSEARIQSINHYHINFTSIHPYIHTQHSSLNSIPNSNIHIHIHIPVMTPGPGPPYDAVTSKSRSGRKTSSWLDVLPMPLSSWNVSR